VNLVLPDQLEDVLIILRRPTEVDPHDNQEKECLRNRLHIEGIDGDSGSLVQLNDQLSHEILDKGSIAR
jgi:hypothetical protein